MNISQSETNVPRLVRGAALGALGVLSLAGCDRYVTGDVSGLAGKDVLTLTQPYSSCSVESIRSTLDHDAYPFGRQRVKVDIKIAGATSEKALATIKKYSRDGYISSTAIGAEYNEKDNQLLNLNSPTKLGDSLKPGVNRFDETLSSTSYIYPGSKANIYLRTETNVMKDHEHRYELVGKQYCGQMSFTNDSWHKVNGHVRLPGASIEETADYSLEVVK